MSDLADEAQQKLEVIQDSVIDNIRAKSLVLEVQPTGYCLFCAADTPNGARWCDAFCRDGWAERKKNAKL